MMNEKLFVYGTLLDPRVQQIVIGRLVDSTPDTLDGFTKSEVTLKNNTYPILVEARGHNVDGRILEVTSEELERIDRYETDSYRRIRVKTKNGAEVWVYAK